MDIHVNERGGRLLAKAIVEALESERFLCEIEEEEDENAEDDLVDLLRMIDPENEYIRLVDESNAAEEEFGS